MKKISLLPAFIFCVLTVNFSVAQQPSVKKPVKIDREFVLEATMLGYIAKDGTRNPVLKAKKGDRVRITIVNAEMMTHDIAMEKGKTKSKVLNEKGQRTSITFTASVSDTYFCTIPGHRQAGMVGKFEVTASADARVITAKGLLPLKNGKPLNLNFETAP